MEKHTTLINLKDIHFHYTSTRHILKDINFSFRENEKIGITGPVGSGKTTLLYLLVGLLQPTAGTIEIFGKKRSEEQDFVEVRQKIGFLFQNSENQLFCPTVAEDIAFGPLNLEIPKTDVVTIVKDTLRRLNLEKYENRISYKLSFGEKKLVSFATVLAMQPEILLLDEPTNGLDDRYTKKITNIIQNEFTSYIIVSHDKEFLQPLCDTVYELKEGNMLTKPVSII